MSDAKQTYPVLSRVRHSGEVYQLNEFISLSAQDAEPLLKIKAIGPHEPTPKIVNTGAEFNLATALVSLIADGHDIKSMNMSDIGALLGANSRGVKRKDVDAALAAIDAQSED